MNSAYMLLGAMALQILAISILTIVSIDRLIASIRARNKICIIVYGSSALALTGVIIYIAYGIFKFC